MFGYYVQALVTGWSPVLRILWAMLGVLSCMTLEWRAMFGDGYFGGDIVFSDAGASMFSDDGCINWLGPCQAHHADSGMFGADDGWCGGYMSQ